MSILVVEPGIQTTVQDAGRLGYYHDGIAPGGPQDSYSFRIANLIVGNGLPPRLFADSDCRGAAGLEMTLKGPTLEFRSDCVVALTGTDMVPTIDGKPVDMWRSLPVREGATLRLGVARAGLLSYLAVAGGIEIPPVLDSRSTCLVARRGGIEGRALKTGDELPIGASANHVNHLAAAPVRSILRVEFPKQPVIRVLLGPQDHLFASESVRAFLDQPWVMSPVSSRMGFRFNGPELSFRQRAPEVVRDSGSDPSNIVDDVIPVGGIQIAGGKQAIVMGVEAPSVGGYAKIATVISADFGILAQVRPGQAVRFASVSLEQATRARREQEQKLKQVADELGQPLSTDGGG